MEAFSTFKPVDTRGQLEGKPVLKYKLLTTNASPPTRATPKSIGYDLKSPRFMRIPPRGGVCQLPLGIAFQIPEGHYGRLAPKSGLAFFRRIDVLAGVIDQDYRGEVKVLLINHDDKLSYMVKPQEEIVQLILERATIADLERVETLDDTDRGSRGAGSFLEQTTALDSGKMERPSVRRWRQSHASLWSNDKN